MKNHNNVIRIFFISLLICFYIVPIYGFAHSGRTDSNGGHRVSATGEYHYHHGQSAHQHYDLDNDGDLDCPLTFDNEKNKSTPKPSIGKVTVEKVQASNVSKSTTTAKATDVTSKKDGSFVFYLITGVPAFFAVLLVYNVVQDANINKQKKIEWQNERAKYQQIYGGKTLESFVQIPPSSYIGNDGLPACKGTKKWGDKYTFYKSETGTKFHGKYGCSGARIPLNIAFVGLYQPCKICKPQPDKIEWFLEYKKIEKIKKDFKID